MVVLPPPAVRLPLSELLRVFREGTDIGLFLTYFRKILTHTVSKLSHATTGQIFISPSEIVWVSRPTKEVGGVLK